VRAIPTSTRVPRDGVPIVAKAMARAKERNDLQKGTSSNPFTILNSAPTVHLRNVMLDLNLACDDINSQIDTFRVEEIVRANLAEANYRQYLERVNEKTSPQGEEDISDLAMGVVTNNERGLTKGDQTLLGLAVCQGGQQDAREINIANNESSHVEC
jgi:hypothetical protein